MKSPPPHVLKGINPSGEKKKRHERRHKERVEFSTNDSELCAIHICWSSSKADRCEQRLRSSDIKDQKNMCSKHHCVCQSDCSKESTEDRPSKNDPRKEDGLHAAKHNRRSKRSSSSERSRKCAKQSSKNMHHRDTCRKEGKNRLQDVLKHICNQPHVTKKSCVEEDSPNRKLSFMETLNLTRSPIKKAALSNDGKQASVDTVDENELDIDGGLQPDVENMQVIDEVNVSELEDVAEEPPKTKDPQSEKCEDERRLQGDGKNGSESIFSDQQVEEHPARAVTACVQPFGAQESQRSVCLTHTSPDSSSFQAGDGHTVEGSTEVTSDSHTDKSGSVEPTAGVTQSSPLLKNTSENPSDKSGVATESFVPGSSAKQKCSPETTEETKDRGHASSSQLRENVPDASSPQSHQSAVLPHRPCSPSTPCTQEKDSDVVSSTISLESLPQEGLSLPDAIYILTQAGESASDVISTTNEKGSLAGCDVVSRISSTTQEVILPDTQGEPAVTPKKSFSPSFEPPSSKPLLHDEDSMMRILSNLIRIPDVISPLRSPIQASKRSHPCPQTKPGYVKSLEEGKNYCIRSSKTSDINTSFLSFTLSTVDCLYCKSLDVCSQSSLKNCHREQSLWV